MDNKICFTNTLYDHILSVHLDMTVEELVGKFIEFISKILKDVGLSCCDMQANQDKLNSCHQNLLRLLKPLSIMYSSAFRWWT